MFAILSTIAFVVALSHRAHSSPEFTTKEVECSAGGFKPYFVYDDALNGTNPKILSITLILGPAGVTEATASDWCKGSIPTDPQAPASQTAALNLTSSILDAAKYTNASNGGLGEDFIPFQQATDGSTGADETRCGGDFEHADDDDNTTKIIKYQVNAKVIVRRKFRGKIIRTTSYPFVIRCALTRENSTLSTTNGFNVSTALIDEPINANDQKVRDIITYEATLKLYEDAAFTTAATGPVTVDNDKQVYIEVKQGDDQDLFKFHVDQCFSTVDSAAAPTNTDHKDVFWDGGCPADSTVTGVVEGTTKYRLTMDSFYFPGEAATAVHFHCMLTVCLASSNDPECVAATDCATNHAIAEDTKRRRRSTEESGVIGSKMITSSQSVLVNQAQVFAPSCGNGFIYDRVLGGCSNQNLAEINGIYLGAAAWDPAYANVTSDAFKSMAAAREYQLWVLLQVTRRTEYIHGVQIVRARQGSVILDVVIKHAASVSAEEAFFQLEQALKTEPSVTRVMNLLQIREGKTIELVPIVVAGEKSDTEKLILIVVVVVLFVVVFIAGVTLFKVRQARQQSSSTTTSFDNKGVDA